MQHANLKTMGNGNRWSGITVDGKSLNSYFDKEKEKQTDVEVKQIYTEEKDDKGKRARRRIVDRTETKTQKRGKKMTKVKQSVINVDNLENALKTTKTLGRRIILHLLAGHNFTGPEYQKWQKDRGVTLTKQQVWSLMSSINSSELGDYITRVREIYDGNRMFRYAMTPDGIELTPKQAYQLFKNVKTPKSKKLKKSKEKEETQVQEENTKAKPETESPAVSVNPNELHVTVDVFFHLKFS